MLIQERLQKLADEELPESQCPWVFEAKKLHKYDFGIQQLVEESWNHGMKAFPNFKDLEKAMTLFRGRNYIYGWLWPKLVYLRRQSKLLALEQTIVVCINQYG